jgi:hypothetical protein
MTDPWPRPAISFYRPQGSVQLSRRPVEENKKQVSLRFPPSPARVSPDETWGVAPVGQVRPRPGGPITAANWVVSPGARGQAAQRLGRPNHRRLLLLSPPGYRQSRPGTGRGGS